MSKALMISLSIVFILILVTASLSFHKLSGNDLYNYCSVALHVPNSEKTSNQKILAARCRDFAERVFFENGYVYVGDETDPKIQDLKNYCPSVWKAPIGGPYVYLVQYWDKNGMSFIDKHLTSADSVATKVYRSLFPKCPDKRKAAGVDKVTEY